MTDQLKLDSCPQVQLPTKVNNVQCTLIFRFIFELQKKVIVN